jgi:hypothetical protein
MQAVDKSWCGPSMSIVYEIRFQLDSHVYTYIVDNLYTQFQPAWGGPSDT